MRSDKPSWLGLGAIAGFTGLSMNWDDSSAFYYYLVNNYSILFLF